MCVKKINSAQLIKSWILVITVFADIAFPGNNSYFLINSPKTGSMHITILKCYMINGWELQHPFHLYFKTVHS